MAGGNPTLYGYVKNTNAQIDPLGLDLGEFINTLPGWLAEEIRRMKELGIVPMLPSDPGFASMADAAGTIKYVLLGDGSLLTAPHTHQTVEISHAAIANGKPVLAAGQVEVAGGQLAVDLRPRSGHYHQGNTMAQNQLSHDRAVEAFESHGVTVAHSSACPHG